MRIDLETNDFSKTDLTCADLPVEGQVSRTTAVLPHVWTSLTFAQPSAQHWTLYEPLCFVDETHLAINYLQNVIPLAERCGEETGKRGRRSSVQYGLAASNGRQAFASIKSRQEIWHVETDLRLSEPQTRNLSEECPLELLFMRFQHVQLFPVRIRVLV